MLWIEFNTDDPNGPDGEDGAARWGQATVEQIDQILEFAEKLLGKPDTIA